MNSCVLMAEIIKEPELRYTPDNQLPVTDMLVQFPGFKAEEPPATLKVVGWGNLAKEIKDNFRKGDRVIIDGRLSMNTIDRPEGFKEKRAELTVSHIYHAGTDADFETSMAVSADDTNVVPFDRTSTTKNAHPVEMEEPADYPTTPKKQPPVTTTPAATKRTTVQPDLDDIPF